MARLIPSDLTRAELGGGASPELDTLRRLQADLPADYTVFHSIHWSREHDGGSQFGEIDFVVLHASGEVLFIEQKSGALAETAAGLTKDYGDGAKDPVRQLHRSMDGVRQKFRWQHPDAGPLRVDYLVYCPDHRLKAARGPGIDPTRIVDAARRDELAAAVRHLLPSGRAAEGPGPGFDTVFDFFRQTFDLVPAIHAHVEAGERSFVRQAGALADLLDNLEMAPWRLRIRATAGSGKSLLAGRFVERHHRAGRRSLLVCFNRPLAEGLRKAAPASATVNTFHGFCHSFLESRGQRVDFSQADREPGFWPRLLERVTAETVPEGDRFDAIAVDEGQDFEQEWLEILRLFLRDDGEFLWLEDPDQNLMMKPPVELPGFVTYRCRKNYRSPASIARYLKDTLPFDFEPANPLPGLGVRVHECADPAEQPKRVARILQELITQGFAHQDIALVSFHGQGRSVFSPLDQVGGVRLRRATGEYDGNNNQVLTPGRLTFETLYRFKGQEAPAVILVDVDPPPSEPERLLRWQRLMYCGVTRGTVRVEVVTLARI